MRRFPLVPRRLVPLAALFCTTALSGCAGVHEALNGPSMSNMAYPAALVPQQQSLLTPMPERTPASANSLWRVGARTFFNDQRARTVGDIVTVLVTVDDSASTSNATTGTRTNSYAAATPTVMGMESYLGKALPAGYNPSTALANNSTATDAGAGTVARAEKISLTIAAVIPGHPGSAHRPRTASVVGLGYCPARGHYRTKYHQPHPARRGPHFLRRQGRSVGNGQDAACPGPDGTV